MAHRFISVRGAREHNLKNVDIDLPRDQLVVITGLSGSGKSSLAFDTIYAEGQRRYVESLSAYARQFLEQMEKPDVDLIEGLSLAISIEQKTTGSNPRSTVGTVTEIYDYLRLLFANIGVPHCPNCGKEIASQSLERIVDMVMLYPQDERINVLAPIVLGRKGEFKKELAGLRVRGYTKARIDGQFRALEEDIKLDRRRNHTIEVVVDRVIVRGGIERRLTESVDVALNLADDIVVINTFEGGDRLFSRRLACVDCGLSMPEMTPRAFSFNSPHGACTECQGLGAMIDFDPHRVVPDESKSLADGAIVPWAKGDRKFVKEALQSLSRDFGIDLNVPFSRLSRKAREVLLFGAGKGFEGLLPNLRRRYEEGSWSEQSELDAFRTLRPCTTCHGHRLKQQSLSVKVKSRTISDYVNLPIGEALDEPSIGLHQRDNRKLLGTLSRLRDLGNTVIVVEHDEETIRVADYVIDLGPGAGDLGGHVIFQGTPTQLMEKAETTADPDFSLTGAYLTGARSIPTPATRRQAVKGELVIRGARENNLKNIDVKIPLGLLTAVTGVSGSGKSTLVNDILYKSLAQTLYKAGDEPGEHDKLEGIELIDKVIEIDQSPIGRTPRSNPATYTGLFTFIRDLFAWMPEAKARGFKPGRFSFNVKGGRCEACQGDGVIAIEMHFLPNVYVTCEACKGRRYNRETLEIKYRGKSIADVLELTVDQAVPLLENLPAISNKLRTLQSVGLGYVALGQSATTLSGGEAQRVKLAKELSKRGTGRTLYILDEPTTGLHFEDTRKLLDVLMKLVDQGNTIVVIEHNLDVIKSADYVIDLGPEGGAGGGRMIAAGTPEEVAHNEQSATGRFLADLLATERGRPMRSEAV